MPYYQHGETTFQIDRDEPITCTIIEELGAQVRIPLADLLAFASARIVGRSAGAAEVARLRDRVEELERIDDERDWNED